MTGTTTSAAPRASRPSLCPWLPALTAIVVAAPALGQSLRLVSDAAAGEPVRVRVGDAVTVHLEADFGALRVAALAAYVTVPERVFAVTDQGLPGLPEVQPFRFGPLFGRAQIPVNRVAADGVAALFPGQQLELAAVFFGSGGDGPRGAGRVASFELTAVAAADGALLTIDDSPVRETKLVASDGSERRFHALEGLAVTVVPGDGATPSAGGWAAVKALAWR